jgi:hypothetical protein
VKRLDGSWHFRLVPESWQICQRGKGNEMRKPSNTTRRNARQSNHNIHDDASPQTGDTSPAAAKSVETATATVVALRKPHRDAGNSLFGDVPVSETVRDSLKTQQEARQLLAEARDLFVQGEGKAEEAKEVSARAGMLLSTARFAGAMTGEQVSAALIDIFGAKAKADGSPSKTPLGQGEAIRKRVVRLADAQDYVDGTRETGFFKDLPKDKVREVLGEFKNGHLGFWAAYEAFAAVKRENASPVPLAFNAKKIAEIVITLGKEGDGAEGAVNVLLSNKALRDAYADLWEMIRLVAGEVKAKLAA